MELCERPSPISHRDPGGPGPGAGNDDSSGPPFIAETVKMAAMDHLQRYQQLVIPGVQAGGDIVDLSQVASPSTNPDVDRLIRLKIIQGMLLNDIHQLLEKIRVLEYQLASQRTDEWISAILLAAGTHAIFETHFIHRLFVRSVHFIPKFICLVGYPVAMYRLFKFEASVNCTRKVRKGLERLENCVRVRERLEDHSSECLEGKSWYKVPWQEVEGF